MNLYGDLGNFSHFYSTRSILVSVYGSISIVDDMDNMRHIIMTVGEKLGLRWIWPRIEHRIAQFYRFSSYFHFWPESTRSLRFEGDLGYVYSP